VLENSVKIVALLLSYLLHTCCNIENETIQSSGQCQSANVPTHMTHGDPKMVTCQASQNAFHILINAFTPLLHYSTFAFYSSSLQQFHIL